MQAKALRSYVPASKDLAHVSNFFRVFCLLHKVPWKMIAALSSFAHEVAAQHRAIASKNSLPQFHLLSIRMKELKLAHMMLINAFRNGII